MISQNEVIDPSNLDKKRSYKDCTVNPDLPENISTSLWEMLKNHKSVFATSKIKGGNLDGMRRGSSVEFFPPFHRFFHLYYL
jgi:hypothetical protein